MSESFCTIVVHDLINALRVEIPTPQSVESALKNHGLLTQATDFVYRQEEEDGPLAVCIRHGNGQVVITWHAAGDDPAAAAAMLRELLAKGGAA